MGPAVKSQVTEHVQAVVCLLARISREQRNSSSPSRAKKRTALICLLTNLVVAGCGSAPQTRLAFRNDALQQNNLPPDDSGALAHLNFLPPSELCGPSAQPEKPIELFAAGKAPSTAQYAIRGAAGFSTETALALSILSLNGLTPETRGLAELVRQSGFDETVPLASPAQGVWGYVLNSSKVSVVYFLGTASLQAVISDLFVAPAPVRLRGPVGTSAADDITFPGKAHAGFMSAHNAVADSLYSALRKRPAEVPVILTGHSFGGALATLAAAVLQKTGLRSVQSIYTFGEPRLGDRTFGHSLLRLIGSRHHRITHGEDIVAHLAPTAHAAESFYTFKDRILPVVPHDSNPLASWDYLHFSPEVHLSQGLLVTITHDKEHDALYWSVMGDDDRAPHEWLTDPAIQQHTARSYFCSLSATLDWQRKF